MQPDNKESFKNKEIKTDPADSKKGHILIKGAIVLAVIGFLIGAVVPRFGSYITQLKKEKILNESREVIAAVEDYNKKNPTSIVDSDKVENIRNKIDPYLEEEMNLQKIEKTDVQTCRQIAEGKDIYINEDGSFKEIASPGTLAQAGK